MRKHLSTYLKIGVTVIGLIYVIATVPLDTVVDELSQVNVGWFVVAILVNLLGLVTRSFRWWLLLRGLGAPVKYGRLLSLYFIGAFFNAFLPTGFGGDVIRVLEVSQDVPADQAAGTVIVDRLSGLMMLFLMVLIALPFRPSDFPDTLLWPIIIVAVAGLIGGIVLFEGRLIRRWGKWLPGKLSITDPKQPLAKLLNAVQGCGWRAVTGALIVSIGFNLLLFGWWQIASRALGYQVPYTYMMLVVPILAVSLLLPSFGGLGVRETLAPSLFASAGLIAAQATSLSFLVFIVLRIGGLIGAPVYIASILAKRKAAEQSQQAVKI
ncbi:MAG: flippase-like domain-containing protein [Chloroflexi bacterium]|nr:flippase-like domain-containing protein [Chloroflexota bacterium]